MYWMMALSVIMMPALAIVIAFMKSIGPHKLVTENGRYAVVPTKLNYAVTWIASLIAVALCIVVLTLVITVYAPTGIAMAIFALLWIVSAIASLQISFDLNDI